MPFAQVAPAVADEALQAAASITRPAGLCGFIKPRSKKPLLMQGMTDG